MHNSSSRGTLVILVILSLAAIILHAELPHFGKPQLMFRGLSNMSVGIHSVEAGFKGEIVVLFNVEFSDKSRNFFTRTFFPNETWSRIEWVVPHETQQIETSGSLKLFHDSSKQIIVSTTRSLDKQRNSQRVLFRERYQRHGWEGGHHISNSSVLASNVEIDLRGNIHTVWLDSYAKNCTRAFYRRKRFNSKHSKEESFDKPILVSNTEFCRANARVHPFIHLMKQDTLVYMWVDQLSETPTQIGHRLVYALSKSFSAKTRVQWMAPQVAFSARNISSLITASCNERSSIISIWKGAVKGFVHANSKALPSFITFYHNNTWSEHMPSSILGNVATVASKFGGYWIMHDTSMDNDAQLLIERRLETSPGRSLDKTIVVAEKRRRSHLSLVESPARRLFAFWVEQGGSGDNLIHEIKYSFAKL